MNLNLSVKCQYCQRIAVGINYRPRPELDNAPACQQHKTSLFIPYANIPQSSKATFSHHEGDLNVRQAKNQAFFDDLINVIMGEFNLLKSEVRYCEDKMKKLDNSQTYGFELPCHITNPYMLLRQDKQMMLNTFLTRIKSKCSKGREKLNSESSGLKNSRCETQNSLTKTSRPFLKNSVISSSRSTNHKSEYTSPNKMSELSYEKKLENIRL